MHVFSPARGIDATPLSFFFGVKIWYSIWGNLSTHVLKILGSGDLRSGHQVTKRGKSGPNLNFLHAPVYPTQFLADFFQTFRVYFVHPFYNISSIFYIADLRSAGGHDLVILSLWENFK